MPVLQPARPRKASCVLAGLGEHKLGSLNSTAVFEMFFLPLTFSVYSMVVFRVSKGCHKGHPDTTGQGPCPWVNEGPAEPQTAGRILCAHILTEACNSKVI